jgi:hypothetical protein
MAYSKRKKEKDFNIFFPFFSSLGRHNNVVCFPHGPWVRDQVLHTMAYQLPRIILFVVPQGLDFHGTLPLLGTCEIKP